MVRGKVAAGQAHDAKAGVEQLIPLVQSEIPELKQLHEVDRVPSQIHQQRSVRYVAAVIPQMGEPHDSSHASALPKQDCRKRIRLGRVGKRTADA